MPQPSVNGPVRMRKKINVNVHNHFELQPAREWARPDSLSVFLSSIFTSADIKSLSFKDKNKPQRKNAFGKSL